MSTTLNMTGSPTAHVAATSSIAVRPCCQPRRVRQTSMMASRRPGRKQRSHARSAPVARGWNKISPMASKIPTPAQRTDTNQRTQTATTAFSFHWSAIHDGWVGAGCLWSDPLNISRRLRRLCWAARSSSPIHLVPRHAIQWDVGISRPQGRIVGLSRIEASRRTSRMSEARDR